MSSFLDRLATARYTSPSGQQILFSFDELSRENTKKAAIHELPFQNSGIIQQLGENTLKYPLTAYIFGKDYDITADRFFASLREKGIGTFDHPRWGELKVVPLTYSQKEQFTENMRFAVFTIEFFENIQKDSPQTKTEQKSKFRDKLEKFKNAASMDFLKKLNLSNLVEKRQAMKTFNSLLSSLENGLETINQTKVEINNQINTVLRNINRVEGLVKDAQSTIDSIITLNFISLDTNDAIANIFNAHKSIQISYQQTYLPNGETEHLSSALQLQVFNVCSIGAMASATIECDFNSKVEAVSSLNSIQEAISNFLIYQETLQTIFANNTIDETYILSNDTYALLMDMISVTYSYILTQLYDLKTEQKIVLEKEITPLTLCWEIYGTIDKLNDFISDNSLKGCELLLLPIGKELKAYV